MGKRLCVADGSTGGVAPVDLADGFIHFLEPLPTPRLQRVIRPMSRACGLNRGPMRTSPLGTDLPVGAVARGDLRPHCIVPCWNDDVHWPSRCDQGTVCINFLELAKVMFRHLE